MSVEYANAEIIAELVRWRDQLDTLINEHQPAMLYGTPRSSQWGAVRDEFLEGKHCASCGGTKQLRAHHRVPFHVDPSRELDVTNLIPLCEAGKFGLNCHLLLGHLGNWRRVNVDVDSDVIRWAHALREAV